MEVPTNADINQKPADRLLSAAHTLVKTPQLAEQGMAPG